MKSPVAVSYTHLDVYKRQVLLQQNDVGRFFCHVNRGVNGDSHIGGAHGGRVIDAVAHKPDNVGVFTQSLNDTGLLHW